LRELALAPSLRRDARVNHLMQRRALTALIFLPTLLAGCVVEDDENTSETEQELSGLSPWGDLRDHSGNCLDVRGGDVANRTPVQTWSCNGYGSQQWQMNTEGGTIKNVKSQRVLDAPYTTDYSTTWIFDWWGGDNQKWSMPSVEIVGLAGKCLDDPYRFETSPKASEISIVWLFQCWNGGNQKWRWDGVHVTNPEGKCLTASWSSPDNVYSVPCASAPDPAQEWAYRSDGTFESSIWHLCLEVKDGNTADRTPITLRSCASISRQQWQLRGPIIGTQSGKCLSSLFSAGSQPSLLPCDANRADQKWTFTAKRPNEWWVFHL